MAETSSDEANWSDLIGLRECQSDCEDSGWRRVAFEPGQEIEIVRESLIKNLGLRILHKHIHWHVTLLFSK